MCVYKQHLSGKSEIVIIQFDLEYVELEYVCIKVELDLYNYCKQMNLLVGKPVLKVCLYPEVILCS